MAEKEQLDIILKAKDQYSKEVTRMENKFKISAKSLAVMGTAVAGAIAGLGAIVQKTANAGDEFQKMALRTGFSVKALSELAHAAELSGTTINQMESSFRKLSKNMSDANDGSAEQVRAFEALGVSVLDANGQLKNSEDAFDEIVAKMADMENETQRTALAMTVFGKSGAQMLPLIKAGTKGIDEMRESAANLGITFTQETADQAAKFNDNMLELTRNVTGLSNSIGNTLIPVVNKLFAIFEDQETVIPKTTQQIQDRIKSLSESLDGIGDQFSGGMAAKLRKELNDLYTELATRQQGPILSGPGGKAVEVDKPKKSPVLKTEKELAAIAKTKVDFQAAEVQRLTEFGIWEASEADKQRVTWANTEAERTANAKTEEEKRAASRQEALERQGDLDAAVIISEYELEQSFNASMAQLDKERTANALKEGKKRVADQKAMNKLKLSATISTAGSISSALDSLNTLNEGRNKSIFQALKVARTAEAVVNTYAGANQALAAYPPPYNFIAAGAVIAAGLANIAVIQSTSFGSSGGGGSSAAVPPTIQPPDTIDTPTLPTTDQGQSQPAQEVTVIINNPLSSENWDAIAEDEIIPAITRAGTRNVTIGVS